MAKIRSKKPELKKRVFLTGKIAIIPKNNKFLLIFLENFSEKPSMVKFKKPEIMDRCEFLKNYFSLKRLFFLK